ncbi:MAG: hypothetical protein KAI24_04565 [Planctomycetes bacterium]|nr:hypothetical protein [Planctomycetota bacterium]
MMSRPILAVSLFAFATSVVSAQAPEDASPDKPLTYEDLLKRHELRPYTTKLSQASSWKGHAFESGAEVPIATLQPDSLSIVLPDGSKGNCSLDMVDIVARANAVRAAWSKEQRAVDQDFLERRVDLWPTKLTMRISMTFGNGVKLKPGDELTMKRCHNGQLVVGTPKCEEDLAIDCYSTDFVGKVREALDDPDRLASHWILSELEGKLVQLPTGRSKRVKKVKVDAKKPFEYTLVYMSADWCGHCHAFNPTILDFYRRNKRHAGKRFEVIWVSNDRSEQEMLGYAQAAGYPWPSVEWSQLQSIPRTQGLRTSGIPYLALLDDRGAVVAATYTGPYDHPDKVLAELQKRLDAKRKRGGSRR